MAESETLVMSKFMLPVAAFIILLLVIEFGSSRLCQTFHAKCVESVTL